MLRNERNVFYILLKLYYEKYSLSGGVRMPIVTIDLLEGYDASAKARLGTAVTGSVLGVLDALPEAVTVVIRDIPQANYFRGGQGRRPGPVLPDARDVVRAYLSAMEARDLATARTHLAPGFTMTFPGGVRMQTLEELIAWSAPRYRFVKKTYERFDVAETTVYCFGTLHGEWPDGTAFEGIRFIDRFELAAGLIVRQDVWNDMGEVRGK
jgi:phenylpyruvate tautomerase PptA (4-oxalocrotonate tautomerase family)